MKGGGDEISGRKGGRRVFRKSRLKRGSPKEKNAASTLYRKQGGDSDFAGGGVARRGNATVEGGIRRKRSAPKPRCRSLAKRRGGGIKL